MNPTEFSNLLSHPQELEESGTKILDEILDEFPYFQAARAVQLNGLNKFKSFRYNQALKRTAAHTIDRAVLFEFITSPLFINEAGIQEEIENIEVVSPETIEALHKKISDKIKTEEIAESELPIETTTTISSEVVEDLLDIGTPIPFKNTEPHSFNEWMQLISKKPIERSDDKKDESDLEPSKMDLVDKFLEANPKINPPEKNQPHAKVISEEQHENVHLMTETLAKVYLEQKKFDSAIKAYRILSLKYPEKSGFFADRIKAIKILQKNKS